MKNIFLDTNVVIDYLADRQPFSESAAELFTFAESKKVKIYVSSLSYNNIYYIVRQSSSHQATVKLLDQLFEMTEVVDVTRSIIQRSLKSDFKDFEDAIQYYSALMIRQLDCIVTRNAKDFKKSELPIMTPAECSSIIKSTGS